MKNVADVMAKLAGTTIIGLTTETPVKLKGGKKNPLQGKVVKRATGINAMVFCNKNIHGYEAMVKRRLEKEGMEADNFTLGKRAWGNRVQNTPFVMHKGNLYLETIFLNSPTSVEYFVDGELTPKADIEGLPVRKEVGGQGGLDNKVIIRTFNIQNIKELKYGKAVYQF